MAQCPWNLHIISKLSCAEPVALQDTLNLISTVVQGFLNTFMTYQVLDSMRRRSARQADSPADDQFIVG